MTQAVEIVRLTLVSDWRERVAMLDPIFFEASATKSFADEAARAAFRERWLGRYLERWPELAFVAIGADGGLVGYIVGTHHDLARDPLFADIGYLPHLADLMAQYPAHLHINLAPGVRSGGVGSRLVTAFSDDARAAGCAGVHLVTGRDSRNRSFYARNGFQAVAELAWGGVPIVMLAKRL